MKLSIVILNYNVKYFLKQCIESVISAIKDRNDIELIIVDNASSDRSIEYIEKYNFNIKIIQNKNNLGFSKGNNMAMNEVHSDYTLFLNPDTIIQSNTLNKVIEYLDNNDKCVALGVKMIDGNGKFLPESKRALPTPKSAFYKLSGLSSLFSKSKKFGKYHLKYLDENEINEVEILSGAFLIFRTKIGREIGFFNEDYFMYGEDIEFSYKLSNYGKIIYYPKTTILHYKGESTKKNSVNYIFNFYNAMLVFAEKNLNLKNINIYKKIIRIAIFFRAIISMINRVINFIYLPIIDCITIIFTFHFMKNILQNSNYIFHSFGIINKSIAIYIIISITLLWFFGAYSKQQNIRNVLKATLSSTLIIMAMYIINSDLFYFYFWQVILLILFITSIMLVMRLLIHSFGIDTNLVINRNRIAILGEFHNADKIKNLLEINFSNTKFKGIISPKYSSDQRFIDNIDNIDIVIKKYNINGLIICKDDCNYDKILFLLEKYKNTLKISIAHPKEMYIINSHSKIKNGEIIKFDKKGISLSENIRKKRMIDIVFSLLFILISPILILFQKNKFFFYINLLQILKNNKTFVSYDRAFDINDLTKINESIFSLKDKFSININKNLNKIYEYDYNVINDIIIIFKNINKIGK